MSSRHRGSTTRFEEVEDKRRKTEKDFEGASEPESGDDNEESVP